MKELLKAITVCGMCFFGTGMLMTGCEDAGDNIEDAADDVGDAVGDAADDVADGVDDATD